MLHLGNMPWLFLGSTSHHCTGYAETLIHPAAELCTSCRRPQVYAVARSVFDLLCEHLFDLFRGQRNRAKARRKAGTHPCVQVVFSLIFTYTQPYTLFTSHQEMDYSRNAKFAVVLQWHCAKVMFIIYTTGYWINNIMPIPLPFLHEPVYRVRADLLKWLLWLRRKHLHCATFWSIQ